MKIKCKNCGRPINSEEELEFNGFCPHCRAPQAGDFSGDCIDDFQILAEIGRGNNGAVFLARQIGLGREAAVKVLLEESLNSPGGVALFFKEARAAAKLNHPNIVQAIAAGRMESGNFYFAMELVDGESVEYMLDHTGVPPYRESLRIAAAIASAMAYAWNTRQLIHGDIKPGNIIMHHGAIPKLADLGIAHFGTVPPGDIMATPLYAPPEVIRAEFPKMGQTSDIYSFGATLYEMFSGSPPFPGSDIDLVLKMQLENPPEPLTVKMGLFDAKVSSFVEAMLQKAPALRPASWEVVADFFAEAYDASQVL